MKAKLGWKVPVFIAVVLNVASSGRKLEAPFSQLSRARVELYARRPPFYQRKMVLIPDLKAGVLLEDRQTTGALAWWFYDLPRWLRLGWQTVEMAIVATVLGAIAGLLASFLCARNLMPIAGATSTKHFTAAWSSGSVSRLRMN